MLADPGNIQCQFCLRHRQEAGKMVQGGPAGRPVAYICHDCVIDAVRQFKLLLTIAGPKFMPKKLQE